MIKEDYVSFETAKLLKEKGFDEECRSFYVKSKECGIELFPSDRSHNYNDGVYPVTSAPTLQMAMKWLREIHNINIAIIPTRQEKLVGCGFVREYCSNIYNDNNIIHISEFITGYEDACEAAIKYCLENLI